MEQNSFTHITDWNQDGKGVARVDGKVIFIDEALPGEIVHWQPVRQKKTYAEGKIIQLLKPSASRQKPRCEYYTSCGGCSSQHIEFTTQVALKQRAWLSQMQRLGKVQPKELIAPIYGWPWHYRQRVTLATNYKRGQLQMGFRARHSHDVVDIAYCLVLPRHVSEALKPIKDVLRHWPENSVGDIKINQGSEVTALTLYVKQITTRMRRDVHQLIRLLQDKTNQRWQWWLNDGQDTVLQTTPSETADLSYNLPEYRISITYSPNDFTQVNQNTNALMVHRAMQWLRPQAGEKIIDWFCGLGNFSLPIARLGAQVTGVEGSVLMCQRAQENARRNGLTKYTHFYQANLFEITSEKIQQLNYADKWLLDPPRAGAQKLIEALNEMNDKYLPIRIVYISCDPATLARDANLLVRRGYQYRAGGIMNLFAQTSHVESIAIFNWVND